MQKIAIIENGFARDTQIYYGDPADIEVDPQWENNFGDVKYACQFVGIFAADTEDEIRKKAAECEGVHPDVITLMDIDGGVVCG